MSTPSGPAVRPLVQSTSTTVPSDALEQRGELTVGDRRMVLQEATVVGEQPAVEGAPDDDVVWAVESSDKEGPEQVIAVRLGNRKQP